MSEEHARRELVRTLAALASVVGARIKQIAAALAPFFPPPRPESENARRRRVRVERRQQRSA